MHWSHTRVFLVSFDRKYSWLLLLLLSLYWEEGFGERTMWHWSADWERAYDKATSLNFIDHPPDRQCLRVRVWISSHATGTSIGRSLFLCLSLVSFVAHFNKHAQHYNLFEKKAKSFISPFANESKEMCISITFGRPIGRTLPAVEFNSCIILYTFMRLTALVRPSLSFFSFSFMFRLKHFFALIASHELLCSRV